MNKFSTAPLKGSLFVLLTSALLVKYRKTFLSRPPRFSILTTLSFWLCVTLYLFNEKYLGIHIFSAALCIGAVYSLLGLTLTTYQWKSLFPPFFLLVLLLPFEGYLDIYLGFPLRLLCADWAGDILSTFGFSSMSRESIILIEGKAASVDPGCSGIQGLWTGCIFFLLLSIIEGHRISRRWLIIVAGFTGCLLMMNVFRIVALVLLALVADLEILADRVHQSLGLLGFSLSCVAAWVALRLNRQNTELQEVEIKNQEKYSFTGLFLFIGCLFLAVWLHHPYGPGKSLDSFSFQLPETIQASDIPLTATEQSFFEKNRASPRKLRFEFKGVHGTLLIVRSRNWKAQHTPRNCYTSQGYSLDFEGTWLLQNGNTVRFIQIDDKSKTAVYWFQSVNRITPDYSARVLSAMKHPHNSWLMVSILWNNPIDRIQAEDFLLRLQSSLSEQLVNVK